MPVQVRIPTPLRPYTGGAPSVPVEAGTVGQALAALARAHPALGPHLLDEEGRLRSFVNVYLGGQDVRGLRGDATEVRDGETLLIVPAVAGGCSAKDGWRRPGPAPADAGPRPQHRLPPAPLATVGSRAAQQALTHEEVRRYSRHLIMPEVGLEGQRRLKAAKVLVIGSGGLGAPLIQYLAAAGVGTMGIVDFDVVQESNLQRQVLFSTRDVGRSKARAAEAYVNALNRHTTVHVYEQRFTRENALDLVRDYDLVVDGTDNFATRYLVNDACVLLGKPNVYGSIFRFEGQVSVFWPGQGPCYRCLYPKPPPPGLVPSCAEGGVLGVLPGVVGAMQATEAIKIIVGTGEPLTGRLLLYDALSMLFTELQLKKDPECPACGTGELKDLVDYEEFCGLRGQEKTADTSFDLAPIEVAPRVRRGEVVLVDVREPQEWDLVRIEGAMFIPLRALAERANELPLDRDIVVQCHTGRRSAQAVQFLRTLGFARVWNLGGGIDRWAQQVEPGMARY